MVLGISIRRKRAKQLPQIRASPSLPNISATGLLEDGETWPQDLVDVTSLRAEAEATFVMVERVSPGRRPSQVEEYASYTNKPSFQSSRFIPSFHRPFRPSASTNDAAPTPTTAQPPPPKESIASLYTAPPSAFPRSSTFPSPHANKSTPVRRVVRSPATFNIMVAGARGTGKTSFLRLLMETCDISPMATDDQKATLERFSQGYEKRTKALRTASIEICEDRHERIMLTVIDTPGLDLEDGRELELERGVSSIVKYIDTQFAETMGEESKVVRKNKEGDQHIHLLVYFIDPDTIMAPIARRAKSALPAKIRSQSAFGRRASLSSISSDDTSDTSEDEAAAVRPTGKKLVRIEETLDPADIRVIARLATRANVLPVIARADTLSDERLALVKKVLARDLDEAEVGFGVFADSTPVTPVPSLPTEADNAQDDAAEEEERSSRPVIKIKTTRRFFMRDRSRSRRKTFGLDDDDLPSTQDNRSVIVASPMPAEGGDGQYTNSPTPATPWSAYSRGDIAGLLPFAVLSPEWPGKSKRSKSHANGNRSMASSPDPNAIAPYYPRRRPSEASTMQSVGVALASPVTPRMGGRSLRKTSLANMKTTAELGGKFTRRYRWGTIDLMEPSHCDFVVLRAAILGTHMKALRNNTKEVLYERFRTEKLLARRATRNITDEDRKKFLQDLGV